MIGDGRGLYRYSYHEVTDGKPMKKLPLFSYIILLVYIGIFFLGIWLSSHQHKVKLNLGTRFEQQKNQLLNEMDILINEEAELTSVERIHKIAKELDMIQSSKPVQVIRGD